MCDFNEEVVLMRFKDGNRRGPDVNMKRHGLRQGKGDYGKVTNPVAGSRI
jgi:hypothetical protein